MQVSSHLEIAINAASWKTGLIKVFPKQRTASGCLDTAGMPFVFLYIEEMPLTK